MKDRRKEGWESESKGEEMRVKKGQRTGRE